MSGLADKRPRRSGSRAKSRGLSRVELSRRIMDAWFLAAVF